MPQFHYEAYDSQGNPKNGQLEHDSAKSARQALRDKGLSIVSLQQSTNDPRSSSPATNEQLAGEFQTLVSPWDRIRRRLTRKQIAPTQLILLTQQISTLVGAGTSIGDALKLMAEQSDDPALAQVCAKLQTSVSEGLSLGRSLVQSPWEFPREYISAISAAEESGHMTETLTQLADDVEHRGQARQKLISALIYPLIMTSISILIVVLMMIYVVPQVANAFSNTGNELPTMTVVVIGLSHLITSYGWYLLAGLAALFIFGMYHYAASLKLRLWVAESSLKLPLFGSLILYSEVARWSRSLGLLLAGGVPTMQSLSIATEVVSNPYLRKHLELACEEVRKGQSVSDALHQVPYWPSFVLHMIQGGEASGSLDIMVKKASIHYEQYLKTRVDLFLKLFEPFLILVMGGVVLLIVLAILLPILQINQLV